MKRFSSKIGVFRFLIASVLIIASNQWVSANDSSFIALKGMDEGAAIGKLLSQNESHYMSTLVGDMNVRINTPYSANTDIIKSEVFNMTLSPADTKSTNTGYIVPANFHIFEERYPDYELNLQVNENYDPILCYTVRAKINISGVKLEGGFEGGGICYYYKDDSGLGWPVANIDDANSFIFIGSNRLDTGEYLSIGMVGEILRGDIYLLSE